MSEWMTIDFIAALGAIVAIWIGLIWLMLRFLIRKDGLGNLDEMGFELLCEERIERKKPLNKKWIRKYKLALYIGVLTLIFLIAYWYFI